MTLNSDEKFEKPWSCGFKCGIRNWVTFHRQKTQKSENCTLMGSFCPKVYTVSARNFQKNYLSWHWRVFKRNLTCRLKNDIRNLVNFHVSSWKPENLNFHWIRLSKACKYLDKKVQKSYVSWHWRVIQSLKKNWLLVPKMTWGIWWILMRAVASLKICTLMCYFCQ